MNEEEEYPDYDQEEYEGIDDLNFGINQRGRVFQMWFRALSNLNKNIIPMIENYHYNLRKTKYQLRLVILHHIS